ncbi:MAG: SurA N-terminal domain-containing protein [Elusimicrobiota bacterium]
MRKHMKKVMWVIAAVFITGIFFWYGSGSGIKNTVAEGENFEIKVKDYRQRVSRQLQSERQNSDGELSDDEIFNIRRQVLSSMVNEAIIYNAANQLKISVPDEEIISTIRRLPQFQHEGRFNMRLYTQALQHSMNMNPAEFEEMIRKNITNQKMERLILATANTTLPELKLYYKSENGNLNGFEDKKEELKNTIIQEKRSAIYRNWISQLHKKADLNVNPEVANLQSQRPAPAQQP